jgi:hypothetical protein
MKRWLAVSALSALVALTTLAGAHAQGTAFTYQGFLRQGGTPANGNHDFQFSLWTEESGGRQIGTTQTVTNVPVQNGLFTVTLDFGKVWDGSPRFLQIAVRPTPASGDPPYTTLSPRVRVSPTPYAILAGNASPIGTARGDLGETYPNPKVVGLQGRPVAATAPESGQVLKWSGSAWAPAADDVSGLTLPFSGSANVNGSVFSITNASTAISAFALHGIISSTSPGSSSAAVRGQNNGTDIHGIGVWGSHSGSGWGVYGTSVSGRGVYGWATATTGTTYGVYGEVASPNGWAGYFVGRGYFSGRVGINTTSPASWLHVQYASGQAGILSRDPSGDTWLPFSDGNAHISAANIIFRTSGVERVRITGAGDVGIGTASPAAKLHVEGMARVKVLEITGADLAEKFPTTETLELGTVVEIDPDNPGHLRKARGAYNKHVTGANGLSTGVVLGNLEGSENHTPIAMSGRVWVYADATHEAIEPGDLLTTSDTPGYAMKASDPSRAHGAVIGKAMTRLEKGKTGMVLVLVNLQ